MNPFHEKLMFGFTLGTSALASWLGAMATNGETRWLFVTLATSMMMSGFMALMFKKPEETIQLVVGRCGLSVFCGIFATRPVVHYLKLESAYSDIISLGGISSLVCVAGFFVGFALLKIVEIKSPAIADKWFKRFTD